MEFDHLVATGHFGNREIEDVDPESLEKVFVIIQLLGHAQLFETPWPAALQSSWSFTVSLHIWCCQRQNFEGTIFIGRQTTLGQTRVE